MEITLNLLLLLPVSIVRCITIEELLLFIVFCVKVRKFLTIGKDIKKSVELFKKVWLYGYQYKYEIELLKVIKIITILPTFV